MIRSKEHKQKKLGIFLYNRLFDPLIQSNFWLYVNDYLQNSHEIRLFLITFENYQFPLSKEQIKLIENWQARGLEWKPLHWSPGIGIRAKMKDILRGFFAVLSFRIKGCQHFVSLASVAGTYLYLYHMVLRFDFFLYQFEPHSEYAIDNGMWNKNSIQFKMANYLERKAAQSAKVISSGTRFMEQRLINDWNVKARFFKIPTVVDDQKFLHNQEIRDSMRMKLAFDPATRVLFYPGKFGDLYYRGEIALMFKWLWELDNQFHFLIVTPHDDEEIIGLFNDAGVDRSLYTIAHSDYTDIHRYYSVADLAVIAVPPGPSKKYISNIKVGEYLVAGIPYLITEGVSEDYLFAIEKKVGVVVKDFKEHFIKNAYPEIDKFLKMKKSELRIRCRMAGLEYRGFKSLNPVFKQAVNYLYN